MSYSKDGLSFDFTDVVSGMFRFSVSTKESIENYLSEQCIELEKFMKSSHPWRNRTGMAEATLSADFYEVYGKNSSFPVTLGIKLEHGVYYGVYLELAMEQRFAILEPTARLKGPGVIRGMHGLLNKNLRGVSWK